MNLSLFKSENRIDVMGDAGVSSAWAKLQDLRGQIGAAERELGEIGSEIAEKRDGGGESRVDRAARALLGGKTFREVSLDDLHGKYNRAAERLPVLRRAADMQEREYKTAVGRASGEICDAMREQHRQVVHNLAEALVALGEATLAEIEFRDALISGGVQFASDLVAMPLSWAGDPRQHNSRIATWLLEAVERGLIDKATVPAAWWRRWHQ